jgi:hypothetical protein
MQSFFVHGTAQPTLLAALFTLLLHGQMKSMSLGGRSFPLKATLPFGGTKSPGLW